MIKRLVLIIGFLLLGLLLQGIGLAETENYCDDPDSWKEWNELIQKYPADMEVQALHALRSGLCVKIDRGNITVEQAIEIFESARETIIEKWKKDEKREKDKHKL